MATWGNLRRVFALPIMHGPTPQTHPPAAILVPLRFGEFLRERHLITDEQLLAALAVHWSERRAPIGRTLVDQGVLPLEIVEAEARAFHDDLDVVEVDAPELS
jgi:hypothetical protein